MGGKVMQSDAKTVEEYLQELPNERRESIVKLRTILKENLPSGYEERMMYGMITYVVPLKTYPKGYHVNKGEEPLPFISLGNQKNYIALYHNGIYAKSDLEQWFRQEYKERVTSKLDMGKSCIRFKNVDKIPYDLIAELARKITVDEFVTLYEESIPEKLK